MDVAEELARAIRDGEVATREDLERMKRLLGARCGSAGVPTDADVLARLGPDPGARALALLRKKPSRSLSGVAVLAIMTPPATCPHGRCAYCPGGVDMGTPQSYTGAEPAALRAGRAAYDPARQTLDRLGQLEGGGHAVDKVEIVVMGGTFPAMAEPGRSDFVRGSLEALNGRSAQGLGEAIAANETAPRRCVALTVETRPDLCDRSGVDDLLALGTTRVEIGVQTTEDAPLEMVGRGHGIAESIAATRNLKDAGLKVGYHMMLGLPGMSREDDVRALGRIIREEAFRPDLLKLYPTLVMPGTPLHEWWEGGRYEPLDEEGAMDILATFKADLPPWVRVSRIERDIPSNLIAAGVRASNLRQLVSRRMVERGTRCRCIRCREVGRRGTDRVGGDGRHRPSPDVGDLELRKVRYAASGGEEVFLSLELPMEDSIVAYARVRRPSDGVWRAELQGAAILREVRVLGEALPLGQGPSDAPGTLQWQHRGLGGRLVAMAGELASEWGMDRLAVMAGMGTRGYWRPKGYELAGPYMVKGLA
jgi:elongator complex protein 3